MSLVRQIARIPAPTWHEAYGLAAFKGKQFRPNYWFIAPERAYTTQKSNRDAFNASATDKPFEQNRVETSVETKTKATAKHKYSAENMRKDVKSYVFTRYIDYVKNYNAVLEKNFPSAVKAYRVFVDGVREFYNDMKTYVKITRIANESPLGLKVLNRKELELYMQMPRDMVKVAPALIGSSLPMIGYVVMPLVFMYPRTFLTTHFWTLQQRYQFREAMLKERLKCYRPILRCLQAKIREIKDPECRKNVDSVLGKLGSGFHPSVDDLLAVKEVFAQPPYSILCLSGKHIKMLCKIHGIHFAGFKRYRLRQHAFLVHYMDLAIIREGGVHNMPTDAMRYACFIRGLHPNNLCNEEMIEWLRNWIKVSTTLEVEHLSLFLHLPLFLAYNHPNNWHLLHCDKPKHKK